MRWGNMSERSCKHSCFMWFTSIRRAAASRFKFPRRPSLSSTHTGPGAVLRDEVVGLAATFLCNSALGRQEALPVRHKSPTWSSGWCSGARQVPPERCSLTQIDAGAIFGSPVLQQQHDPDRDVTLNRPFRMSWAQRQKRRWKNKGLLLPLDVSDTNTPSTVPGWHDTHHFPSLFDQGEHAQDVGLLRSPAHPACGPGGAVLTAFGPPSPAASDQAWHLGWDGEPCKDQRHKTLKRHKAWNTQARLRTALRCIASLSGFEPTTLRLLVLVWNQPWKHNS